MAQETSCNQTIALVDDSKINEETPLVADEKINEEIASNSQEYTLNQQPNIFLFREYSYDEQQNPNATQQNKSNMTSSQISFQEPRCQKSKSCIDDIGDLTDQKQTKYEREIMKKFASKQYSQQDNESVNFIDNIRQSPQSPQKKEQIKQQYGCHAQNSNQRNDLQVNMQQKNGKTNHLHNLFKTQVVKVKKKNQQAFQMAIQRLNPEQKKDLKTFIESNKDDVNFDKWRKIAYGYNDKQKNQQKYNRLEPVREYFKDIFNSGTFVRYIIAKKITVEKKLQLLQYLPFLSAGATNPSSFHHWSKKFDR